MFEPPDLSKFWNEAQSNGAWGGGSNRPQTDWLTLFHDRPEDTKDSLGCWEIETDLLVQGAKVD